MWRPSPWSHACCVVARWHSIAGRRPSTPAVAIHCLLSHTVAPYAIANPCRFLPPQAMLMLLPRIPHTPSLSLPRQAMLTLLPWIVLLGASVELPAAVLLRDGCDQMEDFTYRTLTTAGEEEPALLRAREPVYGFMTGCVESDPMVTYLRRTRTPALARALR